jgi:hypothetical protein
MLRDGPPIVDAAIRLKQCFSLMPQTSWDLVRPAGGGTGLERPERSLHRWAPPWNRAGWPNLSSWSLKEELAMASKLALSTA